VQVVSVTITAKRLDMVQHHFKKRFGCSCHAHIIMFAVDHKNKKTKYYIDGPHYDSQEDY
jgi:hypothetical protein